MMIAMGNSSDPPRGILANEDFLTLASVPCPRATFAGSRGACGEDEERLRILNRTTSKEVIYKRTGVRTDGLRNGQGQSQEKRRDER